MNLMVPYHTAEIYVSLGLERTWDSSVGIANGYGLEDGGVELRVPVWEKFSLLHVVQNGTGVHKSSYAMIIEGSFPGNRTAVA
jgi:hypothetical protein